MFVWVKRFSAVTVPLVFSQILGITVGVGKGVNSLLRPVLILTAPICCLGRLVRGSFVWYLLKVQEVVKKNLSISFQFYLCNIAFL